MLLVVTITLKEGKTTKLYAEQLIRFPTGKMPHGEFKKNNEFKFRETKKVWKNSLGTLFLITFQH